jgi:hypothetical protein
MDKDIKPQEWIDRGYRYHDIPYKQRELNRLADFMLQKRFDDENGKKYYITVYCYDRKKYPVEYRDNTEFGYMPTAHFSLRDNNPFFNIEMNGINNIDEVESYFELFWNTLNRPYYEENVSEIVPT